MTSCDVPFLAGVVCAVVIGSVIGRTVLCAIYALDKKEKP